MGVCVLCLTRVPNNVTTTREGGGPSTWIFSPRGSPGPDVVSLCKLLTTEGPPGLDLEEEGGRVMNGSCTLCGPCRELIQDLERIQEQISQLRNQVRNRILTSNPTLVASSDGGDELRWIRGLLLRCSGSDLGPDDNLTTLTEEVEVKMELDDGTEDQLEQDPLSSTFLLCPEELDTSDVDLDDLVQIGDNDQGPDSDSSFSIITPVVPAQAKPILLRSGGRTPKASTTGQETTRPHKKTTFLSLSKHIVANPPAKRSSRKSAHAIKREFDDNPDPSTPTTSTESGPASGENTKKNKGSRDKDRPKTLKCAHCPTLFSSEAELTPHIQDRHPISCQFCEKRFRFRHQYETHRKTEHPEHPPVKVVASHPCTMCRKRCKRGSYLAQHMVVSHETADKVFFCEEDSCGKKGFSLELNYRRHANLHRVEASRPFLCDTCDSRYPTQDTLDKHVATHDKSVKCDICEKVLYNSVGLARHRLLHTGERPVKCDHCDASFIDGHAKRRHMNRVHPTSTPDQDHLCYICGKRFLDGTNLKYHLERHGGKFNVSCESCGKVFLNKGTLQAHNIREHGADPVICDECGASFKSKKGLKSHKLTRHSTIRPHKCDICKAGFVHKPDLVCHMRKHTGERPYPCPHCDSKFKHRSYLGLHIKTIHTEGYVRPTPHACSWAGCGRKFQYQNYLEGHVRQVHTGEKPFVCEVCNKGFAIKNHLQLHKKSSHGILSANVEGRGARLPRSKRQFPRITPPPQEPKSASNHGVDNPSSSTIPSPSFYDPSSPTYFQL